MIAVYENQEGSPFPAQGKLLYRIPLVDRLFAKPHGNMDAGIGNTVNLYMRKYEKL